MKKICSSIFRVLVIPYVMCGFVAAQNSYTLNGLSELKEFTAGSVEETVENLTLIEPEGSEMIPESEILKLTDRVKKITGTLTMEGLSQLTTTTGLIDVIDCSEAGFVFRDCPVLSDMDAFADEDKFSVCLLYTSPSPRDA